MMNVVMLSVDMLTLMLSVDMLTLMLSVTYVVCHYAKGHSERCSAVWE